jgi:PilZ domain-containing protein
MSKLPPVPSLEKPIAIHLTAVYKSAASLLHELSRAVNRGATRLRSESGLPVGTRLTVGLLTDALRRPIVVSGVVTASTPRGRAFEMLLRYDFDPDQSRRVLNAAMALLRREEPTRSPRASPRLPVALGVDSGDVRSARATNVLNLSRTGCRMRIEGGRLPALQAGDRLSMTLAGGRRGLRRAVPLGLELRWVRTARAGRRRALLVGGAFVDLTPEARSRLSAILRLQDFKPTIRLRGVERAATSLSRARVRRTS